MKTAMKRLLSFVLVAMMLVSVVPFQASALVAGENGKLIFVAADGSVIATEDVSSEDALDQAGVSRLVTGDFYNRKGSNKNGAKKVDLSGVVLYEAGYMVDCKVTIEGIIAAEDKVVDAKIAIPYGESAKKDLLAQVGNWVPEYAARYDVAATTCESVDAENQLVTVNVKVQPKASSKWSVVVNKNGNVANTSTTEVFDVPTADNKDLKAAVDAVVKTIDTEKYEYSVGTWAFNEGEKIASVNITVTEKPTEAPTEEPTTAPTEEPTTAPTTAPTEEPTTAPTEEPTEPADPTVPTGEFAVTFKYCDKEDCTDCDETGDCYSVTLFTKNQKLEMVPGVPDRYGYSFSYWKNNSNGTKGLQDTYTSDITYTAIYKKDADSNLHKLKVYGVIANHGKENVLSVPLATAYVKDEADLLYALQSKATAIQNELNLRGYSEENKYTWDGVTFYDDDDMNSDDKVKTGVEVTGNGNYYVKVNYTGNNKVQLYIHTSKSLTIKDTVTLTTYAPKETISKSQISTAVKNDGWRFDSIKTYTQESWEKIVDGGSADETKSFDVVEGETEIHVYLNGAYSSGSGNNSDNPKTGDTILMAVTAMGLSATALAAVYFFMKKKAV